MELYSKIFIFDKARDKSTGEVIEREKRRKGQELIVEILEVGKPLLYSYISGGSLYTSTVVDYQFDDRELVITTMNSVYTFKLKG